MMEGQTWRPLSFHDLMQGAPFEPLYLSVPRIQTAPQQNQYLPPAGRCQQGYLSSVLVAGPLTTYHIIHSAYCRLVSGPDPPHHRPDSRLPQ